jgi:hypothetical protein
MNYGETAENLMGGQRFREELPISAEGATCYAT